MSVNVKFKVGIKKNINTSFNVENKEPIRTIFRINAGTAAFSSILGGPYDNTALAAALDLKADKTAVAEQIETVTDLINLTSETLDNKIDSVQSSLAGDISTLEQTVESYNAATNLRIDETNTTVADNFTTLNGKIEINTQAISDLTQTVTNNYTAVNNRIDGVVSSFNGDISNLENAIQNEAEARANADTTLQGNINTLSNTVTSNYTTLDTKIDNTKTAIDGDISDLSDTVSANYTDLSGQISDLSGTVESYNTSTNGRIDTLSQTVSANDTAINNKVDGINTTLTNSINNLSDTVTDNYNALDARITANTGNIATNAGNITTINSKIPNQASSSNQLADKDFVNSSIATNTANFIGTFNSVAELEAYTGTLTNNDYAFVATTDAVGNTLYDRYKYNANTQEWKYEYELNNSSFTAQQWASINSGATSTNIGQITINANNIADLQTNKQDVLTAGANIQINNNVISATDTTYTAGTGISIVNGVISNTQTSAIWGNIQGTLSNQTDLQDALDEKYNASNPAGYISGITSAMVTTALGYTPYNATNPNGYITSADLPTNYVTTDTVQDITAKKTFIGDKAINFKQATSADKLGFTLFNTGGTELAAMEYRPNTIGSSALFNLNLVKSSTNYVGFRYHGSNAINIAAPKVATGGNYYIPINFTDGINTVTANNVGTVDLTSLLPDLSGYATQNWVTSQGYTSNVGTVTSVNNVQPDSDGNVEIIIPTADIDNLTISKNTSDELQTIAVIDDNSGNALKYWTGTKAQYDAIATKDANTLYNITDDTDVTLALLELLFPVGAVYFGTMATCPLATLGVGTWQALPPDKVIQIAGARGNVGTTINESLPNIKTRGWDAYGYGTRSAGTSEGITIGNVNNSTGTNSGSGGHYCTYNLDASSANSTYQDNAPVQQDAYLLNGWRRIA